MAGGPYGHQVKKWPGAPSSTVGAGDQESLQARGREVGDSHPGPVGGPLLPASRLHLRCGFLYSASRHIINTSVQRQHSGTGRGAVGDVGVRGWSLAPGWPDSWARSEMFRASIPRADETGRQKQPPRRARHRGSHHSGCHRPGRPPGGHGSRAGLPRNWNFGLQDGFHSVS